MTVSFNRWIAFLAFFAMTWAGTPNHVSANDGLKSSRYGFGTEQKKVEVARQTEANLNRNPFRDKTVSARLTGGVIIIENRAPTNNYAAILPLNEPMAATEAVAKKEKELMAPMCQILPPDFGCTNRNLHMAVVDIGKQVISHTEDLIGKTIENLEFIAHSRDSSLGRVPTSMVTFSSTIHSSAVIRNVRTGPMERIIEANPLKRPETRGISINMVDSREPGADFQTAWDPLETSFDRQIDFPCGTLCMIGLEKEHQAKKELRPNVDLAPVEPAAVLDEPLKSSPVFQQKARNASWGIGENLLIEQFLSRSFESSTDSMETLPSKLDVPAVMISHRTTTKSPKGMTAKAMVRSAATMVKTIFCVVEPLVGAERALSIPRYFRTRMLQLDELIWSTFDLNRFWYPYSEIQ